MHFALKVSQLSALVALSSTLLLPRAEAAPPAASAAPASANDAKASTPPASSAGASAPVTQATAPPDALALATAARHYDAGLRLYSEAEFALAVLEFERAYELTSDYRVLYNIGQVRIQLSAYARALKTLQQYLKDGEGKISPERVEQVHRDLELLAGRTATLKIEADVEGAELLVDGAVVGVSPLAAGVLVDAGEHRVTARKAGFQADSTVVTLVGRDERGTRISLSRLPERAGRSVVIERQVVQTDSESRKTWMWASWATTGVLAVGAAATGGLGISAASKLDDLRRDPSTNRAALDSSQRRARTLLTVADVLGASAVIAGGTALYFTLSAPRSEKPKDRKLGPALGVGVGFNSLQLTGTY
jgi:PEGA domain